MTDTLKQRIARITAPNVIDLELRRNAKFGKLNIERTPFRITARHNAAPYRILEELAIQRMQERI